MAAITLEELLEKVGVHPEKLNEAASDDHLLEIALFLTSWRTVASHLDLGENDLDDAEQGGRKVKDKSLKALQIWRGKFGFKATYRKLVDVLLTLAMADVAEKVCYLLKEDMSVTNGSRIEFQSEVNTTNGGRPSIELQLEGSDTSTTNGAKTELTDAPLSKQPEFKKLSLSEQEKLMVKLYEDEKNMKLQFGSLVTETRESVEKRTTVEKFAVSILALGAYEPVCEVRGRSLLEDHNEEINSAETIAKIFTILNAYWNYLTYEILEYIIKHFGDDSDKDKLKNYNKDLQEFCKRRIFELPPESGNDKTLSPKQEQFRVKLNFRKDSTCKDLLQIRGRIAKILKVNLAALVLSRVDEGCVQLTFLIPKFVAQELFPLSCEQTSALSKDASVTRMEYGHYIFEIASKKYYIGDAATQSTVSFELEGQEEKSQLQKEPHAPQRVAAQAKHPGQYTHPPLCPIDKGNMSEISECLQKLDKTHILNLGMNLGISHSKLTEFSNLTRHAIFHVVSEIAPQSFHTILPDSGSRNYKIEGFCHDLSELFRRTILENPLLTSKEVHRFCERATSVEDFTMLIEKWTLTVTEGTLEEEPIHKLCWRYYEAERKGDVTYPKWLSQESTYGLWLIFNCVLDKELTTRLPQVSVNEVLQRMLELCGYTWDESYGYSKEEALGFPDFLDVVTDLFDDLKLEMSLTSEVIADLVDEIVHDVLRKGYLAKKGHVRKNYKRRWFVLQRTTLRYYQSREKMRLKGKLVLNSNTDVRSIPDKGARRYRFEVTCGETGTLLEILADDQRIKQNWMLAIKKAIALAKVLEGDDTTTQDEVSKRLAGFYRLKYGTSQPTLFRQDSEVQRIKQRASLHRSLENLLDTKPREKKKKRHQRHFSYNSLEAEGIPDRYIKMQPTLFQDMDSTKKLMQLQDRSSGEESSEIDDEGYLKMNHLNSVALSECYFGSPGSTLSPPFLSDDFPPASLPASFTFESPTTDTKRSLEDLMPCSMPEKCGNLGPIDEELAPQPDIDKGEEYELCDIVDPSVPWYVRKSSAPVANRTYVDFTREQYTVVDPLPPSKEDHEVAKLTDDKLSLDPPAEELEASHDKSSTNEYLTLLPPSSVSSLIPLRSNTDGHTESARKGTSPIHTPALKKEKPPIFPRARTSTPKRSKVTRDVPPLPPPHTKLHWQTSSPVLPTVPTHYIPRLSSPSDPFSEVYSKEQRRRSRSPTPVSPTSPTSPSHSDRFSQSLRDDRTMPPLPPRT